MSKDFKPGDLAMIVAVSNPIHQAHVGKVCELVARFHFSATGPKWMGIVKSDTANGEPYWHVIGEGLPDPAAVHELHLMPLTGDRPAVTEQRKATA